jgi:3',5'-cyclic AMP phosphodiesterase CpdA
LTELRIAHFSDTHVLAWKGVGATRFLNKRITGAVNLAFNRAKNYRVEIFEKLLAAVTALAPDHVVCTGDLVNLALEPEFARVKELLAERFAPGALTLVPGNHDYYAKDAVKLGLFERFFAEWQPRDVGEGPGAYPVVRLIDGAAFIGLSTAIPTPVFMATGEVGAEQMAALVRVMARPELANRFRVLLLHHPLLPDGAGPLDRMRRLVDAEKLIESLWRCGREGPDLILHGHNHAFLRSELPGTRVPIVQVASGSRYGREHRAEFNVYVIRDRQLAAIERHIYDQDADKFVASDETGAPLKIVRPKPVAEAAS